MPEGRDLQEEFGPLVWGTIYRIIGDITEAEDCFQDVFVEVLERSPSNPVRNWAAYLRWLATRRALNQVKRSRRIARRSQPRGVASSLTSPLPDPAETAEHRETLEILCRAIAQLPDREREAVWLHCVEQMSHQEIAAQIQVSPNAVRVLVHRGRKKLCQMLVGLKAATG